MILVKIYKKVGNNKYVMSFFNGIKSAVVAILLSTGILFASLNWLNIPYGIFGVIVLIILLLIKIEPIFLILGGAIFSLIIG
jgi:chromate transport protein ChrA